MQSTTKIQPSNPPNRPHHCRGPSLLLFGGVGQLYLGQQKKGIILILATILLSCIGVGIIVWILGAVDAYVIASRLKEGKAVGCTWSSSGSRRPKGWRGHPLGHRITEGKHT